MRVKIHASRSSETALFLYLYWTKPNTKPMEKALILLFIFFLSISSFAQKVKIKDNIATVDGVEYVKWEKRAMSTEAYVSNLTTGEEEISMMYLDYYDPTSISNSNPKGRVVWIEVYFLTLDIRCEVDSRTHKGLVKMLYQSNIYVNGVLNEENAQKFVKRYGMRYSENRPGTDVNIIINN
jgi:hypothetical protein